MTLAAHATKEDLTDYLSADSAALVDAWGDDGTDRILERASLAVDDLSARASFTLDDNGNAADPNIAAGLRMATCALVEQWMEVGEENDIDGLAGDQISVTGFSGHRAPLAGPRVLRPLKRCGLLTQPESMSTLGWSTL